MSKTITTRITAEVQSPCCCLPGCCRVVIGSRSRHAPLVTERPPPFGRFAVVRHRASSEFSTAMFGDYRISTRPEFRSARYRACQCDVHAMSENRCNHIKTSEVCSSRDLWAITRSSDGPSLPADLLATWARLSIPHRRHPSPGGSGDRNWLRTGQRSPQCLDRWLVCVSFATANTICRKLPPTVPVWRGRSSLGYP